MTRLARVELRRLFSRRFAWLAFLAALVVTGLLVFSLGEQSKPLSGAELQMQQQSFEQAQKDWKAHGPQMVKSCLKGQAEERKTNPEADFGCDKLEPTLANWGKPAPQLGQLASSGLRDVSYVLGFVAFILGAGFVAAEFSTGAIGNWLTFEPRRVRVYGSKLAAAGLGVLPLGVVMVGLTIAGAFVISSMWGSTALTGAQSAHLWWGALRVVVLTVVSGVVGAAFGGLLRHTAAVIGVAAAYIVLVEGIFAGVLSSSQPWLVTKNIDAWVQHGTTYGVSQCHLDSGGNYACNYVEKTLSFGHGAVYLAVATAVIALLSGWLFRRRDVT